MTALDITSPRIHGSRTLRIDPGEAPICLFLDGDFYRNRIGIPDDLSGLRAATLSGGTPADRHRDFTCAGHYTAFLIERVLPELGDVAVLVGVSLSGLAAAYMGLEHPELFPRIVAQSPSAWWNEEWLVRRVQARGRSATNAWFSVGDQETQTNVRHPPTAMHQRTSQWDSVARLAGAWGEAATLQTFSGGHEFASR